MYVLRQRIYVGSRIPQTSKEQDVYSKKLKDTPRDVVFASLCQDPRALGLEYDVTQTHSLVEQRSHCNHHHVRDLCIKQSLADGTDKFTADLASQTTQNGGQLTVLLFKEVLSK
jgi:hypothetical protein